MTGSSASPCGTARRPRLPLQLCGTDVSQVLADPSRWAALVKWDGWRCQAVVHPDGSARLWSRQGRQLLASFPEIGQECLAVVGDRPDTVLDGELIVLSSSGLPDFDAVCGRGAAEGARACAAALRRPAVLVVFDVLLDRGVDVRPLPWQERRERLDALPLSTELVPGQAALVRADAHDDLAGLLQATHDAGLEGIVLADRAAPYRAGRSNAWVKVKHPYARDLQPEAVARFRRSG